MGVCPVMGDYVYEDGVARHNTDRLAADLLELVVQAPATKSSSTSP
jgi:hypothetical protein